MTGLRAKMSPTLELLATDCTTSRLLEPATLVLEILLATDTRLLHKKRAWWARYIVRVAMVRDRRMATRSVSNAVEATLWRSGAAWLRRLKHGTATMATDLVKYCFRTRGTRPRVTEQLTFMLAALQRSSTLADTDVLAFHFFIRGTQILLLPLGSHSRDGLLLARAAMQVVQVSSTIELGPANPHALRDLCRPLVAHCFGCGSPTSAGDFHVLQAWRTCRVVADILALVSTR